VPLGADEEVGMQIEALRRVSLQQPFKLGACSPAASKNQVAALEQRSRVAKNQADSGTLADKLAGSGPKLLSNPARQSGRFCIRKTFRLLRYIRLKANMAPTAIDAGEANVTGSVVLTGVRAEGVVRLQAAKIGAYLICSGGNFITSGGFALDAEEVNIEGTVYLNSYFEADGIVRFRGSRIDHAFVWQDVAFPEKAILDLRSAKAKTLLNQETSWPKQGNLFLHGFIFDELDNDAGLNAQTQINWIRRQPRDHFVSQPYEQMAAVLRNMGLQEESVKVMIAKNYDHGVHPLGFKEVVWYGVVGPFIGFGYTPWNAFYQNSAHSDFTFR
jgi:hypothetical protein